MPLEPFNASSDLTMGVELELQLVNPTDFDLSDSANDVLHLLSRKPFPGDVKPKMTMSMIEVATDTHFRHDELLAQLRRMRNALLEAGDRLNVAISGGGTHPFQHWFEQRISEKPHFQQLSALYGYLAKQFAVFGQHIHIGCASADDALALLHGLNRYLPHFIALSASSPFSQGVDTRFDSARLNSISAFPLSGHAPFILDWSGFESGYFAKMEKTGVVSSMKDFSWDIRPQPEHGTIELRVCDTPLTVERAAALACYLQALCRMLLARREPLPVEDDYLVYNYNRFQACRFGLDGTIVHPRTAEKMSLREDILTTAHQIELDADVLHSRAALDEIRAIVSQGNDATYLRNWYKRDGGVQGSVAAAVRRFREGDSA